MNNEVANQTISLLEANYPTFTNAQLCKIKLSSEQVARLAEALKRNCYVNELNLAGCCLGDDKLKVLYQGLARNTSLTNVDLSNNELTEESVELMNELMQVNSSLERIILVEQPKKSHSKSPSKPTEQSQSASPSASASASPSASASASPSQQTHNASVLSSSGDSSRNRKRGGSLLIPSEFVKQQLRAEMNSESLDVQQVEAMLGAMNREELGQLCREQHSSIRSLNSKLQESAKIEAKLLQRIERLEQELLKEKEAKGSDKKGFGSILKRKHSNKKKKMTLNLDNINVGHQLASVGGSNAGVFSCYCDGWNCAMKELDIDESGEETIQSFEGEIRLIELLPQHPNIVRYLFHERVDNKIRLFMTNYSASLDKIITFRRGDGRKMRPFSAAEVKQILMDVARGIVFLHSNDIIHRDLKSDNIFVILDERKEVKSCAIGDFDSSRRLIGRQVAKTFCGTAQWMPPEIAIKAVTEQEITYTFSVDVYSFGMVAYELITLLMPYEGSKRAEVLDRICEGKLPKIPSKLDSSYTPLVQLFYDCVKFNPEERPSAIEVLGRLVSMAI